MAYTGPDFVNGGPPAINAANLNGMVDELERLSPIGDETLDIRNGINGETYASAGDAVRATSSDLNSISEPKKNLFNKDNVNYIIAKIDNGVLVANNYTKIVYVPCKPNTTYTVSKMLSSRFSVGWTKTVPAIGVPVYGNITHSDYLSITNTTGADAKYLYIVAYYSSTDTASFEEICATIQIEYGNQATTYEPYELTAIDNIAREDIDNIEKLSILSSGTELTSGIDLNDLSDGVYYSPNSSVTASLINCPIGSGNLKVISFHRYSTYRIQLLFGAVYKGIYFRTEGGTGFTEWNHLGDSIESLIVKPASITPTYDTDIAPALSTYTGNNATYDDGKWDFSAGGDISCTVTVEANETYLISLGVEDAGTAETPLLLNVLLGNDNVSIFAAADGYWYVSLTPTESGSKTFKIKSVDAWQGKITSVAIQKVLTIAPNIISMFRCNVKETNDSNLSFGGHLVLAKGENNTAFGRNAQSRINTSRWNTAVGTNAQQTLRNGTGNTAVGSGAQNRIVSGCYNNAVGNAAQHKITSGCWNNSIGNETLLELTTGSNNMAMGRRSLCALIDGNNNVGIGKWAGFNGINIDIQSPEQLGQCSIHANAQTLIGAEARQDSEDSDYLVLIGYQTRGSEKGTAIGSKAKANGKNSIAIGFEAETDTDNDIVIGSDSHTVRFGNRQLVFNLDGTVTWTTVS